jgi:aminobenzoyl-glutamate transport protein
MLVSHASVGRFLQRIETLGNRLPHPTMLFIYLCGFILLCSGIAAWLQASAIHPITNETIQVKSLLSGEGLREILSNAVKNFTSFAPVGTVLVAVMGIGVAEHSGLLGVALKAMVQNASQKMTTFLVVLAGVLSSLAADTGYVVLVPLAGLVFLAAGRHPVAGIAAAFAGVSGGYSANLLIGPLDAILAGISTEAAMLVQPSYEVSAAGNYYFIVVSTFLIAAVGTYVTERWVAPMLGDYKKPEEYKKLGESQTETDYENNQQADESKNQTTHINSNDKKALKAVGLFSVFYILLLLVCVMPEGGILRNPETGSILRSPFISGIVVIIAIYAALSGWLFGKVSGRFESSRDFISGMEAAMVTMASYLVLMFFAAQFVNWFAWSQLGTITAIKGAQFLQVLDPNSAVLLICFMLLAAFINLLIGSASAKWALLAPIFVPMLLLAGISPEATQVAYRIGDSSTNIITPLMPYFGVVVAFVQKYDAKAGIGTLLAIMLPFSLLFLLCWSVLLAVWIMFGIPLGPDAGVFVS